MRIRYKKWARPELEASSFYEDEPEKWKGKWKEFFKAYSEHFGHIIFFSGMGWDLNIKERAIEELTDNAFYYMKICPFYYIKREELIKKVCSGYLAEYPTLNIEEKSKKINEDIKCF